MICTIVHVWVKPEFRDAFIVASKANHLGSIQEEGNLRFDLLQDANDVNKFVFYEGYLTEEDILKHKETAHYQTWRDTVQDMMAQPRKGEKHTVIAPLDKKLW